MAYVKITVRTESVKPALNIEHILKSQTKTTRKAYDGRGEQLHGHYKMHEHKTSVVRGGFKLRVRVSSWWVAVSCLGNKRKVRYAYNLILSRFQAFSLVFRETYEDYQNTTTATLTGGLTKKSPRLFEFAGSQFFGISREDFLVKLCM